MRPAPRTLRTAVLAFALAGLLAPAVSATSPTLADFWAGTASFKDDQRVCATDPPVNAEWDYHYHLHDSGMAVLEWPAGSGTVYYIAEHWKDNNPFYLEPHLYKSTDGGKTFTHRTKLFDVDNTGTCSCASGSTTACWNSLLGQNWCLFQMREPDVMRYNGSFWITWEAVGKNSSGQDIMGIAVARLDSLDVTTPQQVHFGNTFRQHPLFTANYDGNPAVAGTQTISSSTPVWSSDTAGVYVHWAGVYPSNGTWQRVDGYRGHFGSTPGQPAPDCTHPILCFFVFDEYLVTNPNLGPGTAGTYDTANINPQSIVKEGSHFYMLYTGGISPADGSFGMARSAAGSVWGTGWVRKYDGGVNPPVYRNGCGGVYGKLAKIGADWWLYFLDSREPGAPNGISRVYRRKLKWNSEQNMPDLRPCYSLVP